MAREVELTRIVALSCGHRYWRSDWTAEQNRSAFGAFASPFSHGHNYVIEVTYAGAVNSDDGMVINIKTLDDLIRTQLVDPLHQRSLNDEIPYFATTSPSLENFLAFARERLSAPDGVRLTHLLIRELPELWAEWTPTTMVTLTRTYEFSASHRLHLPQLSQEENVALFGKCNHVHGHGHNYVLEVTVTGEPDPQTGWICDLGALDQVVEREILDRYDHRHLNCDIPELSGKNPTSELVGQAIFDRLNGQLPAQLVQIKLFETPRSAFVVRA